MSVTYGLNGWAWVSVGAVVVYALFWLVMLVDCLRRREFYPILGSNRATKIFWLVTFVLFNPVITFLYFICGMLKGPRPVAARWASGLVVLLVVLAGAVSLWPWGRPGEEAFTLTRDPVTGAMVSDLEERPSGFKVRASVVKCSQGMSSSHSYGSGSDSCFPCSCVMIMNKSSHELMGRVGEALAEKLGECDFIERVEYYPVGEWPAVGGRTPDLMITLDAPRVKRMGWPLFGQLEAEVEAKAVTDWATETGRFVQSSSTLPVVSLNWEALISHSSSVMGYESRGARYVQQASEIAEDLEEGLVGSLVELAEEHGALPGLPAEFYGEYRPVPEMGFASWDNVRLEMSTAGLCHFNRTTWAMEDDRETFVVLSELRDSLVKEGWKEESDFDPLSESSLVLEMSREERKLVACRRLGASDDSVGIERAGEQADRPEIVISYCEPFSKEDQCLALDALLVADVPAQTVLRFESMMWRCGMEMVNRFWDRIDRAPDDEVGPLVRVRGCVVRKDFEEGRRLLRKEVLRASLRHKYEEVRKKCERLAKDLGDESLAESALKDGDVEEFGFGVWVDPAETVEGEIESGGVMAVFVRWEGEEPLIFSAGVERCNGFTVHSTLCFWCSTTRIREGEGNQLSASMSSTMGLMPMEENTNQLNIGERKVRIAMVPVDGGRYRLSFSVTEEAVGTADSGTR